MIPTNIHDIVTGTDQDGTGLDNLNCDAWTSGHMAPLTPSCDILLIRRGTASGSRGFAPNCNQAGLAAGGGNGRIYCFAAD